jgi:RNA polymerase sigma-70 factor (ECF subfamily)
MPLGLQGNLGSWPDQGRPTAQLERNNPPRFAFNPPQPAEVARSQKRRGASDQQRRELGMAMTQTATPHAQALRPDPASEEFRTAMLSVMPRLLAFARVLTRNREAAEDLAQDTVVRALRAQHSFEPGSNMLAWLCTILRNQHISGLRRKRHDAMPIDDLPDSAASIGANQDDVVEMSEIRRALLKLSPEHREVLVMVAAAGLSYTEAAEICGCAVGTVKSRVNRARNELRRLLSGGVEITAEDLRLAA